MEESSNFDSMTFSTSTCKTLILYLTFEGAPTQPRLAWVPMLWQINYHWKWQNWSFKVSYKQEAYSNSRQSVKLKNFDYPRIWYIMKVTMLLNVFYYEGVCLWKQNLASWRHQHTLLLTIQWYCLDKIVHRRKESKRYFIFNKRYKWHI